MSEESRPVQGNIGPIAHLTEYEIRSILGNDYECLIDVPVSSVREKLTGSVQEITERVQW